GRAEAVGGQHHGGHGQAGQQGQPPGGGDVVPALGDQQSPFGRGRRGAVAEEAEGGDLQDRGAQLQGGERQDGGGGVGQDVAPQDAEQGAAGAVGGFDVLAAPHLEHPGAGEPREGGDRGDAHGDRGVGGAEAQQDHHGQRQQQAGDGQQHVHQAHQRLLDQPADGPGEHAEGGAGDEPHRHGDQGGGERVGGAVDHPGIDVASGRVRAEPVCGARRLERLGGRGGGAESGEQARGQRPREREQQQQGGEHHGGTEIG